MSKLAALSIKFRLFRLIVFLLLLPFIKKIRGNLNLPKEGPFIIAANHLSHIDPFLVGIYISRVMNRHVHFLANPRYIWNPLFKFLVEISHSVWADARIGGRSLLVTLEYLKHGEIVGILPEGTRSPDGKIRKGKTGIAALALTAKVPVVPIGVINTHKVLPRGAWHPHFAKCQVNIGKPLILDVYYKEYDNAIDGDDKSRMLDIEEKALRIIMKEIAKLSNQEYPY